MAMIYTYYKDNTVRDERVHCDNTSLHYTAILMAVKMPFSDDFFFCLLKT